MLTHIVVFKLRDGFAWKDAAVQRAAAVTRGHPQHIPSIMSWRCGPNTVLRRDSFDFGVVAEFASAEDLERYQVHPDHLRGKELWEPLATWVVVDLIHES